MTKFDDIRQFLDTLLKKNKHTTRIITSLALMFTVFIAEAKTFSYHFSAIPLTEALRIIMEDHPELDINFIFNELETYKTSATVRADNAYDALRQAIGLNPVTVVKSTNRYYLEALQHGKYVYTGKAVGSDNEPVVAATVMLLAPKDSTVITYGITDVHGRFSIPCDSQEVLAKISCVGFKTVYKTFDSFSVGTIVMPELPITLKTLRVEGENVSLLADRSIYRPTQRQKSASQNAIDLLRQMAIPQISINLMDNAVTTLTGQNVALYINYLPASSEEIEGMNTADVKKIECLDFPNDPRFNGNEHVVNFIMQKYEYGGYTKITGTENFLAGFSNRESIYSKFTYKRMSYDLYLGISNHNLHHVGTSYIGTFDITDDRETTEKLTRRELFDNAHFKYNEVPLTFRAIYDSDNIQISNTAGFVYDQSPIAETSGEISYSPEIIATSTYKRQEPYKTEHLTWAGSYYFIFPHSFHLSVNPSAIYSHTNYTYTYHYDKGGEIENRSRENAYQLRGSATLYKIIAQNQNIFFRGYGGTNRNNVAYYGTSPYENSFSDSYAGATLGYNFSNRRWTFNVDAALQWEQNKINDIGIKEVYPLINLSTAFSPTNRHSVRAYFHFGANYPGASDKTPNILQQNELLYITGNPNLGLSRQVTLNLQYNWTPRNNFSTSLYAQYFGEYNLFVPVYSPYNDGKALLKSFEANADYNRTQIGVSCNYKLLEGKLQLSAQPSITFFRMRGLYDINKTPFKVSASASYYIKNFYFQAAYQSANKTVQGNRAAIYSDRSFYQILAGWSHSGWNIRLSGMNLFRNDWLAASQSFNSPLYFELKLIGGNNYHRRINVSITYTFNYGKKVKEGNEIGEQSGVSSAIMK